MKALPEFDAFSAPYDRGEHQVVWTTLVSDLETPVSAMLKLADGRPNSFLLESVEGGSIRGRYSFIGLKPDVIWRCFGNRAEINRKARYDAGAFEPCPVSEKSGTLDSLRAIIDESKVTLPRGLPPMAAGLFGYMGYDTVRLAEKLPDNNPDTLGIPDGIFLRPTVIAVFDTIEDVVTVVTPVRPKEGIDARHAYDQACERLSEVVNDFSRNLPYRREAGSETGVLPAPKSNMTREAFHEMVRKAKQYIFAGDIFQAVLSQRFTLPFTLPPFSLYRALRRTNPSPFLFFLDFDGFSLVGSSPEILVRLRDGKVTIRPIAGTRPRGATPEQDEELAADLKSDPKELAEHLMLLDLGRNDVGRVAKIGTVKVTQREIVEYYSHVMHIVSNVEGQIDPKHDAMDALMAGFPAGTVSGAPKVRAMEIIDELETERRSFYAGCIGYFGADGDMDTCIALRTALVKDGTLYAQAGGGIVADSDPEGEYQESCNKAKALIRAAQEAVRFATER
ncbi:MAG: anthranilate synthase component I [Rhodospirillales bacterium]|nr:anthranilate synthase component I [Rhodospirillales bacterium]MCW8862564.1 anthranilate synthase component I [Rhodospirillales bacterium]MCW8952105.1 anthranilate synthase component I [Rhodospirillales bacterium]MCW8971133.1 anthranilate synthase component I [Rhodospirillales bacterium]MCW9001179.1 anthranilate synthase component I [Rhodospirillales bacterium]